MMLPMSVHLAIFERFSSTTITSGCGFCSGSSILVWFVDEGAVLRKLHEVCRLEEFAQLVDGIFVIHFLQMLDDLVGGHLHRIETIAFLDVVTQSICQLRIIFLRVFTLPSPP